MAIVVGNVSHPKLQGLRLRQYYITSAGNTNTVTLGIPNIREVAVRTGIGTTNIINAAGSSGDFTDTLLSGWVGSLAAARRVAAHLSNAATGEITFYSGSGASTCVLMVWSAD